MDRIVGIETEYGCLMSSEELRCNSEVWPAKVKNYLFNKARAGTIDLHYRDYEEPPGNGGFQIGMSSEELGCNSEVWPAKVKNYLFNKARAGTIDLHYRDYEEPPGNGGF